VNARGGFRRALVWALAAVFFALAVWSFIVADSDGWWILLAWGGYPVVGATILTSRSGNWVGRLLLFIGLGWAAYGALALSDVAQTMPVWVEILAEATGYLVWLAIPFLVLVFPSGRIATRPGRVLAAAGIILAAIMVLVAFLDPAPLQLSGRERPWAIPSLAPITAVILDGGFLIIPTLMIAALAELIRRWRLATGAERLQFQWFAFGVAVVALTLTVSQFFPEMPQPVAMASAVCLNAMPVAIGIAVTRHGLYEINRVISRTVTYGIVTVIAIGTYAVIVTSVTWVLPDAPSISVAAATLAAAALCLPLLRRVQRTLDRQFDRERYDAERIVDKFGERLRTEIDPTRTTADLTAAVERTLRPRAVGLWTREGES
jgi:hypothetical protein